MQFRTVHEDGRIVWVRAYGRGLIDKTGKLFRLQGTCQDITEIKLENEQRKAILDLAESIQSVANIGGWRLELATNETTWTSQTYEIYGIPLGTPMNKIKGIEHYAEHERDKLIQLIGACAQDGVPFDERFEFYDAKGNKKFVRSIGRPVYDLNKNITHLEGTFQDVSAEVQQENDLKESNTYLDLAIKGANLGIWDWYLNDNSVHFDNRWAEMLGIDYETIEHQLSTWESRVHPEDLEQCYKDIKDYLDGKTDSYENIHRMKHENGSWVYILDRGQISEWDEEGNPLRFTGTHLDITEVESLKRERDIILKQFEVGIFKWDIVNNYLEWDDSMYKVYEVDKNDFTNAYEAWESTLAPESREHALKELEDALNNVKPFQTDFKIITKAGKTKYIRGVGNIDRDAEGNPIRMTGVNSDVTAQVLAQRELEHQRENQNRQSNLVSIGELAAGVGHEINNPLAIISGYMEILNRMISNQSLEEKTLFQMSSKISKAVNRIGNIVKGLRNFSRSNDGEMKEFKIVEALKETIWLVKEIYSKEGINLIFDDKKLEDFDHFFIKGNRGQIQQVLMNLIANAKDATDDQEESEPFNTQTQEETPPGGSAASLSLVEECQCSTSFSHFTMSPAFRITGSFPFS